jgi:hypothetical protein
MSAATTGITANFQTSGLTPKSILYPATFNNTKFTKCNIFNKSRIVS